MQESRKQIESIYRRVLKVTSALSTVSEDIACVIAGLLPSAVLAEEGQALYWRKKRLSCPEEFRTEEQQNSTYRWHVLWDAAMKDRWTYRLIPQVYKWLNWKQGNVNYNLTQMVPGHRCFRAYLHKFMKHKVSEYQNCPGIIGDAEYVFFTCACLNLQRNTLGTALDEKIRLKTTVEKMLSSTAAWDTFVQYNARNSAAMKLVTKASQLREIGTQGQKKESRSVKLAHSQAFQSGKVL
ncbi:hypothetical protein EVAR_67957_1 [Eumeta japonica]|uniref:Uncharacterized protein n=1 Tax=Eumeta variegata TaxID=151549 RepID=A0A4C1TDT0_EUMVA|nr:hypothetical protein EVAR_67957_1 [Eumeta japonica]